MTSREKYLLTLITTLAAALRIYGLAEESLWLDEAYVASRISGSYLDTVVHWDVQWQGSFFAVLEKIWCDLFGRSEFALRSLPALFGSLAVPALYLLGRRIFSPAIGLVAAFLLAINPFAIHFSQDARPYSLFLLLVVLSIEFGLRLLAEDSKRNRTLFALATLGALYAHPFGVFLLPLLVALPFAKNEGVHRGYQRMVVVAAVLYVPMCVVFLRSLLLKSSGVLHDADFIQPATWTLLGNIYRKYFMSVDAAWFSVALILGAAMWGAIRKADLRVWRVPELLGVCFVLLPALLSWLVTPVLVYRYTIPALAGIVLLLAWSVMTLPRWLGTLCLMTLTIFSGIALQDYYTKVDKDPWRQTVEMMRAHIAPGDYVAAEPFWLEKPLHYYLQPEDSVIKVTAVIPAMNDTICLWRITQGADTALRAQFEQDGTLYVKRVLTISTKDSLDKNPEAYTIKNVRADLYQVTARADGIATPQKY